MITAIRIAFLAFVLTGAAAMAQTPGIGETRPAAPGARDSSAADSPIKSGSEKDREAVRTSDNHLSATKCSSITRRQNDASEVFALARRNTPRRRNSRPCIAA